MTVAPSVIDRFFGAVRFLTIVPVPSNASEPTFGSAAFPVVGLLIGLAVVAADEILGFLPFELRSIALVAFLAVLTGGLHHDGLADTLDALGGRDRTERLRILADPSAGTYAIVGVVVAIATKISSLMLLGEPTRLVALVVAPALGRSAMVIAAYRAPAAKAEGLGASFTAAVTAADFLFASAVALVAAVALAGWLGLVAIAFAAAIVVAVRLAATRMLGGITGDVLGAICEIVETLLLAFFATTRMES